MFGFILKIFFREPVSVDARVVLLVEDDTTLYIPMDLETLGVCKHTNEKIDSRTTKI